MAALVIFLVLFALVAIAPLAGWGADTRDRRFTVGPMLDRPRNDRAA